jgi:Spy/CpxP family protein refolding chaperone
MRTHRSATATSALVLALVFCSGAVVGGAFSSRMGTADAMAAEARDPDTGERRSERRTPMYEQVGITDAQRVSIDSIMVDARNRHRAIQTEHREAYEVQYRALLDSVRETIKGVMTDDQRVEYDALLRASDERRAARREERDREEEAGGRNEEGGRNE